MRHIHGGDIYKESIQKRIEGGNERLLDFSANLNPLGMPASVREAACAGVEMSVNYPDTDCKGLIKAIIEEEGAGWGLNENQVICANGAAELIFMAAGALKPKTVLLADPGFAEYEQAACLWNSRIKRYVCREEDGFVLGEAFPDFIDKDTDLVFLCNPNNPTGRLIPGELLEKIVFRCHETGTILVLDECFVPLTKEPEQISMLGMVQSIPELFILKAFTKLYAMPGLRLGYGYSSNEGLLGKMRERVQPWNVSLPAQMAGMAAMREKDYAIKSREYIAREREFLMEGLTAAGMTCFEGAANFLFFKGPENLDEICLNKGILIRDCSNFHSLTRGCWRIAVRTHEENIRLLEAVKGAV